MVFFSCGQGISVNFPAYIVTIVTIVTMRDKSKSSQNTDSSKTMLGKERE